MQIFHIQPNHRQKFITKVFLQVFYACKAYFAMFPFRFSLALKMDAENSHAPDSLQSLFYSVKNLRQFLHVHICLLLVNLACMTMSKILNRKASDRLYIFAFLCHELVHKYICPFYVGEYPLLMQPDAFLKSSLYTNMLRKVNKPELHEGL